MVQPSDNWTEREEDADSANMVKQLRIEHSAMVALLRRVADEVLPHEYGDLAEDAQSLLADIAARSHRQAG